MLGVTYTRSCRCSGWDTPCAPVSDGGRMCSPQRLYLPFPRRASRSSAHHPPTASATPSPHPTARASKPRAPRRWSGSLAWPSGGLARPPRSARDQGSDGTTIFSCRAIFAVASLHTACHIQLSGGRRKDYRSYLPLHGSRSGGSFTSKN
jgi:hypothetical protein